MKHACCDLTTGPKKLRKLHTLHQWHQLPFIPARRRTSVLLGSSFCGFTQKQRREYKNVDGRYAPCSRGRRRKDRRDAGGREHLQFDEAESGGCGGYSLLSFRRRRHLFSPTNPPDENLCTNPASHTKSLDWSSARFQRNIMR